MPKHRVTRLLALMSALACSGPAMAYPENPFLTPEHPTTSDDIVFNAYAGPCDLLQHPFEEPIVTVTDRQVTVQLSGEHQDDPIWCVLGSRIDQVNLGTFPPGSYNVTVNWRYYTWTGWVYVPLGVLPMTISGQPAAEPVSLPASDGFSLTVLVLGLIVLATARLSRCTA